jgi:hypothetical protein
MNWQEIFLPVLIQIHMYDQISLFKSTPISQGCIAHEILASGAPAKMIGSTSRGLFLLAPSTDR